MAHRLLYHSTLGLTVIKKKKKRERRSPETEPANTALHSHCRICIFASGKDGFSLCCLSTVHFTYFCFMSPLERVGGVHPSGLVFEAHRLLYHSA